MQATALNVMEIPTLGVQVPEVTIAVGVTAVRKQLLFSAKTIRMQLTSLQLQPRVT